MCDCFSCRFKTALEGKEFEERVEQEDYLELTDEEQLEFQIELYDTFTDQAEVCGT